MLLALMYHNFCLCIAMYVSAANNWVVVVMESNQYNDGILLCSTRNENREAEVKAESNAVVFSEES